MSRALSSVLSSVHVSHDISAPIAIMAPISHQITSCQRTKDQDNNNNNASTHAYQLAKLERQGGAPGLKLYLFNISISASGLLACSLLIQSRN